MLARPGAVDMLTTLDAIRDELASLELVVAEEKLRNVNERTLHGGMNAVLQIIARKPR